MCRPTFVAPEDFGTPQIEISDGSNYASASQQGFIGKIDDHNLAYGDGNGNCGIFTGLKPEESLFLVDKHGG